jgi:hypothetical protein
MKIAKKFRMERSNQYLGVSFRNYKDTFMAFVGISKKYVNPCPHQYLFCKNYFTSPRANQHHQTSTRSAYASHYRESHFLNVLARIPDHPPPPSYRVQDFLAHTPPSDQHWDPHPPPTSYSGSSTLPAYGRPPSE